ncbi:DNA-processing protein DprA [Actinoplanes sp. NPDC051859]|uniref:DNA-processing protein DprA n=1 Tax=Actinoplanes sp. NPDC051859 TaxID=3363909 RepID=UPI00378985DB
MSTPVTHDETVRDIRAALSHYVGHHLPTDPSGTTRHQEAFIGSEVLPGRSSITGADLTRYGREARERAAAAGIHMLIAGDPGWPPGTGCDQLPCLWVRGDTDIARLLKRSVAVTGTKVCSDYGISRAAELGSGLADERCTVVTNLGSGTDLHVANTVTAVESTRLIVISAGGLDHQYADPLGDLLRSCNGPGRAVISPVPPGYLPDRPRLRLRRHLLGTLTPATVLIEALDRDDVLEVAHAARGSGRIVCAMPGIGHTPTSAGCRQLLTDGITRRVTCARDVVGTLTNPDGSTTASGFYTVAALVRHADGTTCEPRRSPSTPRHRLMPRTPPSTSSPPPPPAPSNYTSPSTATPASRRSSPSALLPDPTAPPPWAAPPRGRCCPHPSARRAPTMSRLTSLPDAVRRIFIPGSARRARHGTDRPRVWVDLHPIQHGATAGDDDHLANLRSLLDPRSHEFGTDVSALVDGYLERQVLQFTAPVTAIGIEPTVNGAYRDGGFLVMVTIADALTVASHHWHPDAFLDAVDVPDAVLAAVVDTTDRLVHTFFATAIATKERS